MLAILDMNEGWYPGHFKAFVTASFITSFLYAIFECTKSCDQLKTEQSDSIL